MKYTCTVDIELDIDEVARLWADEDNFKKWQDGFQHIELLEGQSGAVGAKSKILFQQGKKTLELIETIVVNDLPREKKALYEHKDMTNFQSTKFERLSENKTRYISEVSYTKFNGLLPKLMAKLFPSVFKKQSQKWMDQFKVFVEDPKER